MRYLIDTNIFLFLKTDADLIGRDIRPILNSYEDLLYISSVSVQELIHLYQTERLPKIDWKKAGDILASIKEAGISIAPVKEEHLKTFANLENVKGHNDPNDRVIISQAMTEKMPLISSDRKFEYYRKQGLNFIYNRR